MRSYATILILLGALLTVVVSSVFGAATPSLMTYQGQLADAGGAPVTGTYSMLFTIYNDPTLSGSSNIIWQEAHPLVLVTNGLFSVILGTGTPPVPLTEAVYESPDRWLGIKVGSDPEISPRSRLSSVAYSQKVSTIHQARGGIISGSVALEPGLKKNLQLDPPTIIILSTPTDTVLRLAPPAPSYIRGDLRVSGTVSTTGAPGIFVHTETSSPTEVRGALMEGVNNGTGSVYGVDALATGNNSVGAMGVHGHGINGGSGRVDGGYFEASPEGTGEHYGVRATAQGSSFTCGVSALTNVSGTGNGLGGAFDASSSGSGNVCGVTASGSGISTTPFAEGVHASVSSNNPSGFVFGVSSLSQNNSSGMAYGANFETNSAGTGDHIGVRGYGPSSSAGSSIGCLGHGFNSSSGAAYGGVFSSGGTGGTGSHIGVDAGAQGFSSAATFGVKSSADNNSSGDVYGGRFEATASGDGTKYGIYATALANQGWAGYFNGDVRITDSLVVLGGKSAAVKVDNGDYHLFYSQESPEVWFEDFGRGQLANGRAHIELDALFLQTVTIDERHPMEVFIQLRDNCNGTYVKASSTGFDVLELNDGTSSAAFSYRIAAKRKGFENIRLAKMDGPAPEAVEAEQVKYRAEMEQQRAAMEEERQRMAAGRKKLEQERQRMENEQK